MSSEFTAAVRSMLLPIAQGHEEAYLGFVSERLNAIGVPAEDHATWVAVELRKWRAGAASPAYQNLVRDALFLANRQPQTFMFEGLDDPLWQEVASRAAHNYFDIHLSLCSNYLLGNDAARQLISHSGMIARLAIIERMTASEIGRIISIRDRRFENNWRAVREILSKFGISPSISLVDFQSTFRDDESSERNLLADLGIEGSIDLVAKVANDLGCPGDFGLWLNDIFIGDRHEPYLLILHFQLIVQDHYDHAPTFPYEFSPRGNNARWLTDQYAAAGIPVAQNAFLNNAKATLRFDGHWVAGRTDHGRGARALSNILVQMESLGALAKVEIATHLRALLRRYVRVQLERHGPLPHRIGQLSIDDWRRLCGAVGQANSGTTGIIEQRLIDCAGTLEHPAGDEWFARGTGDSVFAANLPRRKIGDVEFMRARPNNPAIVAYEAHGGQLSRAYVYDHVNSLDEIFRLRVEELRAISSLDRWQFIVRFVAHSFRGELPDRHIVLLGNESVIVWLEYIRFDQALAGLPERDGFLDVAHALIIEPMNDPFIHPDVRIRFNALIV